ncbi:MAG: hypothetical protein K2M76_00425, partial [Muribaculaceae bacterium]|nr:hypothetical protein [Muribaculaceae bacterium]
NGTLRKLLSDQADLMRIVRDSLKTLNQNQINCKTTCADNLRTELLKYYTKSEIDAMFADKLNVNNTETQTVIQNIINNYIQNIANGKSLPDALKDIEDRLAAIESVSGGNLSQYVQIILDNQAAIESITGRMNNLGDSIRNMAGMLAMVQIDAAKALSLAKADSVRLDAAEAAIADLQAADLELNGRIDSLANVTKTLQDSIDSVAKIAAENLQKANDYTDAAVAQLKGEIDTKISQLTTQFMDILTPMLTDIAQLQSDVAANTAAINTLQSSVDALAGWKTQVDEALKKMITGILVQGVENPIFGSLALPVDVRSNILLAYYGYSENMTHMFPYDQQQYEYNSEEVITDADWDMLGNVKNVYTVPQNEFIMPENEGNAGRIYVTINPNTVNFQGQSLELVNSQDAPSPIKLSPVVKSNKLLTFGYSRAENGFYEVAATLPKDGNAINACRMTMEEGYKSTIKDALKDRSKSNLLALVQKTYEQFKDFLPAYGLKANYLDYMGNHSVYSQYNIAATCFKPLSYKFAAGTSLKKLPHLPTIDIDWENLVKGEFNFHLDPVNIDLSDLRFRFTFQKITFSERDTIWVDVVVPDLETYSQDPEKYRDGTVPIPTKVTRVAVTELTDYMKEIQQSINESITGWEGNLNDEFDRMLATLQDQINTEVNKLIGNINGKLDGAIQDMLKDMIGDVRDNFGAYVNKLNNYINRVNRVFNRINKYLEDPNLVLQTAMLFESNGNYYWVSQNKGVPTRVVMAGGNAMKMMPTTYTAEIVSPAFKKFVAVTNVYYGTTSAQDGDATCIDLLKKANSVEYMNQVVDGGRLTVPFYAEKAGYIYEIVYSALDYHGYTSTRKYYVMTAEK